MRLEVLQNPTRSNFSRIPHSIHADVRTLINDPNRYSLVSICSFYLISLFKFSLIERACYKVYTR